MSSQRESDHWVGKQIFTTGEAAEICGLSQQTIIRCFDSGRIEGFRVPGSRFRRIPRASLIAFMKANNINPAALLGTRRTILLLMNEPAWAAAIRTHLQHDRRNDVVVASDPFHAGVVVGTTTPAAVLIDGDMDGLDPNAVIRTLRETGERRVRAIVLMRKQDREIVRTLLAAGASEVLVRPTEASVLADRLGDLLD